jgi:hypothetical protein
MEIKPIKSRNENSTRLKFWMKPLKVPKSVIKFPINRRDAHEIKPKK